MHIYFIFQGFSNITSWLQVDNYGIAVSIRGNFGDLIQILTLHFHKRAIKQPTENLTSDVTHFVIHMVAMLFGFIPKKE